jgi:hypothetical protein
MELAPDRYHPQWDIRLEQGDHSEALVAAGLAGETHEVKSDSYAKRTGFFFIEFEQERRDGTWRPSGIAITKADRWDLVIDPATKVFISVPTNRLRRLADEARKDPKRIRQTRQTSAQTNGAWPPARGALVAITEIIGMEGDFVPNQPPHHYGGMN